MGRPPMFKQKMEKVDVRIPSDVIAQIVEIAGKEDRQYPDMFRRIVNLGITVWQQNNERPRKTEPRKGNGSRN